MSGPRLPLPHRRRAALAPAALLGVVAALTAGCGGGAVRSTGHSSPAGPLSSSATPVSPRPSTPSRSAGSTGSTGSTGTATPGTGPGAPGGLAAHLIGAGAVPAFGGVHTWTVQATGPAGPEPFGACQEYDFATIGAKDAVVRAFDPAGGPATTTAVERLVSFPDATNAARAAKVLDSFRARCQQRMAPQLPGLRVSQARDVSVGSDGSATAYTVTWKPQGGSGTHTQVVGTVRRGDVIAVVTLETDASGGVADKAVEQVLGAAAHALP